MPFSIAAVLGGLLFKAEREDWILVCDKKEEEGDAVGLGPEIGEEVEEAGPATSPEKSAMLRSIFLFAHCFAMRFWISKARQFFGPRLQAGCWTIDSLLCYFQRFLLHRIKQF
ncbi:MAG: hypothetical protein D4S02_05055 [Rhodocyclaceae bacterium]|nr:MAG: hypothetical protein D4S02_05055 [Rhodocyclaceae bacterium]